MLNVIIYKMLHNKILTLFLFGSAVLFSALISSIPLFTNGIMQRILIKDLEGYQIQNGDYAGKITYTLDYFDLDSDPVETFLNLSEKVEKNWYPMMATPARMSTTQVALNGFKMKQINYLGYEESQVAPFIELTAVKEAEDHIQIVQGRAPSGNMEEGVIEVMVSQECFMNKKLLLDEPYEYLIPGIFNNPDAEREVPFHTVIVTGIFKPDPSTMEFWPEKFNEYSGSAFIPYDQFNRLFIENPTTKLSSTIWYYALDYSKLKAANLDSFIRAYKRCKIKAGGEKVQLMFASEPILGEYTGRARYLTIILWFLYIPILILLSFLIYMISQLLVDSERSNITVMKSRGASNTQVLFIHLIESFLVAGTALIIGPWLGYFFCSVIGSSNGFLEFVQRAPLSLQVNGETILYAVVGSLFFVVTMMVPVLKATQISIVKLKRSKNKRKSSKPFWKKYFLDLILMAISIYGLISYQNQSKILATTGAQGTDLPVDPLLFGVSTLFILSSGLLILRLIPFMINLIFKLRRRHWSSVTFGALIQVIRSGGKEEFLILFMIFSLALGIFDSTAARTLNRNMEEKIRYKNGADIILDLFWNIERSNSAFQKEMQIMMMGLSPEQNLQTTNRPVLEEPPFEEFLELPGVESAAKVAQQELTVILPGDRTKIIDFMAIRPEHFGKMAWMRNNLFPIHWYNYLNVLAKNPHGVLLSKSFKEDFGINLGDTISLKWDESTRLEVVVFGFVDYWPSLMPLDEKAKNKYHIIANIEYIFGFIGVIPYNVWIGRDTTVSREKLYQAIKKSDLPIVKVTDTTQELKQRKNDPLLQGINGVFSLGFIICIIICITGFTIYWLFSLQERMMQLGIFRAMGLSRFSIILMLLIEQVLLVGSAFLGGILTGSLTSRFFVPLLQIVDSTSSQVPPFQVFVDNTDIYRLAIICFMMFAVGTVFFKRLIDRMQIARSLKLGED